MTFSLGTQIRLIWLTTANGYPGGVASYMVYPGGDGGVTIWELAGWVAWRVRTAGRTAEAG